MVAMDIIHTNVLGIPRFKGHIPIVQNSLMKGMHPGLSFEHT